MSVWHAQRSQSRYFSDTPRILGNYSFVNCNIDIVNKLACIMFSYIEMVYVIAHSYCFCYDS